MESILLLVNVHWGFNRSSCQLNIDDCSPNSCLNGATCVDGIDTFTCQCLSGYTGSFCQTDIHDCTPNPCQNRGNFTDGINSFACQCPPGYTGMSCQATIDDCPPAGCENGGVSCMGRLNLLLLFSLLFIVSLSTLVLND